MFFLYAPVTCSCLFQFFLLLSFSLQTSAMFDNTTAGINFLVLVAMTSPLFKNLKMGHLAHVTQDYTD